MDASVGHVSQNDGLVLSKRQVDPELFSMSQERQPTADTFDESLVQRKNRAKSREARAHNDVLRSSNEASGI